MKALNVVSKVTVSTLFILVGLNSAFAESIPKNYDSLSACSKQEVLWSQIQATEHQTLPELAELGVKEAALMAAQELTTKKARYSDIAPKNWKKYLHRRGVVAKVKFVTEEGSPYTGLFKGADCGLLRLSLTYKPQGTKRGVAPGLALKLFRDKEAYSSNVSALYTLNGQGSDYNFFTHALSNIVPTGSSPSLQFIHRLFKRVTGYPEELLLTDFAESGADSLLVKERKAPRQLFFVPNKDVVSRAESSEPHDFRKDVLQIKEGSLLYMVYALSEKADFNYTSDYTGAMIESFEKKAEPIGQLITTSDFKASEFGDSRIFFRHEVRPKKNKAK